MTAAKGLEVHRHSFVRGRRANGGCYGPGGAWLLSTFSHSHEGGSAPHQHPDIGPASFTIDKDAWARATGLKGGGRKVFTAAPTGEQFAIVELEAWQTTFEVILGTPTPPAWGTGPGVALPLRMVLQFGMTGIVRVDRPTRKRNA
jgi:hypothetical protein